MITDSRTQRDFNYDSMIEIIMITTDNTITIIDYHIIEKLKLKCIQLMNNYYDYNNMIIIID